MRDSLLSFFRGPERLTALAGVLLVVLSAALFGVGWRYSAAVRTSRAQAERSAGVVAGQLAEEVLDAAMVSGLGIALETFVPAMSARRADLGAAVAEMDARARRHDHVCGCRAIDPAVVALLDAATGAIVEADGPGRRPLAPDERRALTVLADTAATNLRQFRILVAGHAAEPMLLVARVFESGEARRLAAAIVIPASEFGPKALAPALRDVLANRFGAVPGRDSMVALQATIPGGHVVYRSPWQGTGIGASASSPIGPTGALFSGRVTINPSMVQYAVLGGLPESPDRLLLALGAVLLLVVGAALLALQRARQLMTSRTLFLSGVSHELRTPLTQILLYAETLHEGATEPDRRRRATGVIIRETRRLIHLVENVLLFARGARAHVPLNRRVERLAPLIQGALDDLTPLLDRQAIRLEALLDPDAAALVDGAALRQILGNLIDNALRYGPRGQWLRVSLTKNGETIELAVEDEGPGVPAADRARVLLPFERSPGAGGQGAGIGLALVHQLTVAMGGTVRIEAAVPRGARIVVRLPRATAPKAEAIS
ncbi:MAG: HAMP domain-containing sensor histidine kinase [Gemmatimonadales bacterium]